MTLEDLLNKTCLIGLHYFDLKGNLIKQNQHAGKVINVDAENGISIQLGNSSDDKDEAIAENHIATDKGERIFVLPPVLRTWFQAPGGDYRDNEHNLLISDPDYLVIWEVHKTQSEKQGEHEWWEWVIPTSAPAVN